MSLRLVYIAGPFTAPARAGIERNIAAAVAVGVEVARLGAMPVIPHANTSDERFTDVQGYEFWCTGTMELMRGCKAVLTVPGWEASGGATREVAEASRLGVPVFHSVSELGQWLQAATPMGEPAYHALIAEDEGPPTLRDAGAGAR